MTEQVRARVPLSCWRGERGTYHLVTLTGSPAKAIAMHERLRRLEFGGRRGFGSVKVIARIGDTGWKTSVFPQTPSPSSGQAIAQQEREWILLVSKKVMRAEDLAEGDEVAVELKLL
ncbi:DUF1905 domain-containing protein [Qipengyuania oceanensis]|uniref:DUF1905 domain-containing protein n=1 Tax=Qipengyuania oceanensis TaxID=1463597 RepID=A0A844YM14_9SPHN|nr:DUF1905 domain-containing protein [Qipengyuania oceanensis]MXO64068.1 DUF1905 domain-containing protein [Qipengyuania oceanensis]